MKNAATLLLAAVVAGMASAQDAVPTPIPQSVVVPSLPDQKNKETNVKPSGALATDAAGWVRNGPDATGGSTTTTNPRNAPSRVFPGGSPGGVIPAPAPAPAPSGPAVVNAAFVSVHGTVKAYRAGSSITIVDTSGRERTVSLAPNAAVYQGLRAGDKVVLRIPLEQPATGKAADKVEKEKPKTTPPKSKFAAAQTPGS